MLINSRLLQGIRTRLGNAISPNFDTASDTSDLFEAYIFSIVIRAAINEAASVSYRDSSNTASTSLSFRKAPGRIYVTNPLYTHAVIAFPEKPLLEAHISVKIQGKLKVLRECDVSVIFQEEANECRLKGRDPRSLKLLFAIECKHYTGKLDLELADQFIGFASILGLHKDDWYFVSNSSSPVVAKILAGDRRKWQHEVTPGKPNNANRLMYSIQDNFKNFKAKF